MSLQTAFLAFSFTFHTVNAVPAVSSSDENATTDSLPTPQVLGIPPQDGKFSLQTIKHDPAGIPKGLDGLVQRSGVQDEVNVGSTRVNPHQTYQKFEGLTKAGGTYPSASGHQRKVFLC